MTALLNARVSAALATRFGSEEDADCCILFVRSTAAEPAAGPDSVAAPEAAPADGIGAAQVRPGEALAEPLPAHKIVLRAASEQFRIKIDYQKAGQLDGGTLTAGGSLPTANAGALAGLPVIKVPLRNIAEVPAARAAIRFAYMGVVESGSSVREALELYRQGQYLQVEGCGAACIAAIEKQLEALPSGGSSGKGGRAGSGCGGGRGSDGGDGSAGGSSADSSSGLSSSVQQRLLEFFSCSSLWPEDPAFVPVLADAKPKLVSHFGDAITALNTPQLRQQLLALPAEGLEVLLQSDDFGTDVEDSVMLLLATWLQQNGDRAGAVTVERLCRLVRLAQLSPGFAEVILPALPYARWFPIKPAEAIHLLSRCTGAGVEAKRQRLMEAAKDKHGPQAPWFSSKPRRQCLTSGHFEWTIQEERLFALQPGSVQRVDGRFNNGLPVFPARGFEWYPSIDYNPAVEAVGIYLRCSLPSAYRLDEASLGGPLAATAQVGRARLEVDRWRDGLREVAFAHTFTADSYFEIGRGLGRPAALPLKPLPAAEASGGGKGSGTKPRWADYLHEGKLHGRVVLLPRTS
ncbi:hypothetical protein GPECTOR_77g7 [Gonium pectorale]|uniref:BACK domain-containing protein n=1 Tax=Gonium pectorale TaxID=33097 RepID=A0A150G296_GONPE|nr:hypothetical protein GPECTOR_77g7 [Gonium pectorale]|eukprot:KXZ43953.1 hypothetical protein GPECTOR_77g7 [Gonium pectorale]